MTRTTPAEKGGTVLTEGGHLKEPLGLALAPNGNIITTNGGDGNMVETTPAGKQVATKTADTKTGAGSLFGLVVAPGGKGIYFVDDGDNTLRLLHWADDRGRAPAPRKFAAPAASIGEATTSERKTDDRFSQAADRATAQSSRRDLEGVRGGRDARLRCVVRRDRVRVRLGRDQLRVQLHARRARARQLVGADAVRALARDQPPPAVQEQRMPGILAPADGLARREGEARLGRRTAPSGPCTAATARCRSRSTVTRCTASPRTSANGEVNGQDIKSFGGTWHVLSTSGTPSSKAPATNAPAEKTPSMPAPTSGGGGYGY